MTQILALRFDWECISLRGEKFTGHRWDSNPGPSRLGGVDFVAVFIMLVFTQHHVNSRVHSSMVLQTKQATFCFEYLTVQKFIKYHVEFIFVCFLKIQKKTLSFYVICCIVMQSTIP